MLAPAPVKRQPAGRSANAAGGATGSSTQRVSATRLLKSVAAMTACTGETYQPADPFGAAGVSVVVVAGGVESTKGGRVTMSDHASAFLSRRRNYPRRARSRFRPCSGHRGGTRADGIRREFRSTSWSMLHQEGSMPKSDDEDLTIVPLPSSDTQSEHDRIRHSNDRDQQLEREGKPSRHNRGYDDAADGPAQPEIERVVDEP
jgi:hypothetical protein